MERKPAGFWTRDENVKAMMLGFVQGEEDLDTTTAALRAYCADLGVDQTAATIRADVLWYARGIRKALGLLGVLESARQARAQVELQG